MKFLHITTGDKDGIGLESAVKALCGIGERKNVQFFLWRDKETPAFLDTKFRELYSKFHVVQKTEISSQKIDKKISLVDMASSNTPLMWVRQAGQLCLENPDSTALATGPLSKIQIQKEGSSFKGHTDMLKEMTGCLDLFMCFLGEKFNVVLLTDHQPISKVKITSEVLDRCIQKTLLFRKKLSVEQKKKPVGVLGLNPHAGEEGILGDEEILIFQSVLKKYKKTEVLGPLTPDTAFDPNNWRKYSFYICAYHDQGLIPFKMIHSRKGVHTTLGLPFIRTSVDHGTAKDIFSQGKADSISMKKAIELALTLLNPQ